MTTTDNQEHTMTTPRQHNPNFFKREDDGSVRLRLKFDNETASLFEEAAGKTPVMVWLRRTLDTAAKRQVKEQRRLLQQIRPPEDDQA
jgi:hypothetical protein